MFRVNGMNIDVEPQQLLEDLKLTLSKQGIYLLHTIKPANDNIQFSCPSHKDGQERKPSCGMLTVDKGGSPAGTVHCFTCGYTATLPEFISFCFGYNDGGIIGNKWLKVNYRSELIQRERTVNVAVPTRHKGRTQLPTIPDNVLDNLRYTHSYMYKRGLTDELIDMFDIGYDRENNTITFPVSNLKGEVKWIQSRNIDYKFYRIPEGIIKTDYLYAGYECIKANAREIYIVESPLNALTFWKYGKYAVALFGTGGGRQYDLLRMLPARHYILALDNDAAGRKGEDIIYEKLKNVKLLSTIVYEELDKDINDLQQDALNLKKISLNF